MEEIKDQVAVVTGGSRGIGAAISKELGKQGAHVVINYNHHKEQAEEVLHAVKEAGGDGMVVQADIAEGQSTRDMIQKTVGEYGRIDILVNNAGITRDRSFKKMSEEEWNAVISTNLNSVYNTTHTALPHMLDKGYGRVINISSIVAQAGAFGQTNYGAAKAGLIGFTRSLALETASKGITVNAICPGYIATEMVQAMPQKVIEQIEQSVPMGRLGKPEEVARVVPWIVETDYMTGQCINLNGGLQM